MTIRSLFAAGMVSSSLWLAGCGSSSGPSTTEHAKAEPLTEEAKAAYQAQLDEANNAELEQQRRDKPTLTGKQRARAADDEERAAQRR